MRQLLIIILCIVCIICIIYWYNHEPIDGFWDATPQSLLCENGILHGESEAHLYLEQNGDKIHGYIMSIGPQSINTQINIENGIARTDTHKWRIKLDKHRDIMRWLDPKTCKILFEWRKNKIITRAINDNASA